jgi:hypothetical protein
MIVKLINTAYNGEINVTASTVLESIFNDEKPLDINNISVQLTITTNNVATKIVLLNILKNNNDSFNISTVWFLVNGTLNIFLVFEKPNITHIIKNGNIPTNNKLGISKNRIKSFFSLITKTDKTKIKAAIITDKKYLYFSLFSINLSTKYLKIPFIFFIIFMPPVIWFI